MCLLLARMDLVAEDDLVFAGEMLDKLIIRGDRYLFYLSGSSLIGFKELCDLQVPSSSLPASLDADFIMCTICGGELLCGYFRRNEIVACLRCYPTLKRNGRLVPLCSYSSSLLFAAREDLVKRVVDVGAARWDTFGYDRDAFMK